MGSYHPLAVFFFIRPKTRNQKESDLSHPGDLSDILHGHFDEKNGGTTSPGARVSRQRAGVGWLPPEKTQIAILEM